LILATCVMTADAKIRQAESPARIGKRPNAARAIPHFLATGSLQVAQSPETRDRTVRSAPGFALSVSDETRALAPPFVTHGKGLHTPSLTSILIYQNAVEVRYRLRRFTRATRAARLIATRDNEIEGNSISVPYRLRRPTCAASWGAKALRHNECIRGAFSVPYRLRRLTRARGVAGVTAKRDNEIDGNSLPVPHRLRSLTRAKPRSSSCLGRYQNNGDALSVLYRLRRLTRAGFWCAVYDSTARNYRFSPEILINGSAIRMPRNHPKTITGDRLRSTVKGGRSEDSEG
jgi:hypothetical protein